MKKMRERVSLILVLIILMQVIAPVIGNIEIVSSVKALTTDDGEFEYTELDDGTIEISKYLGSDTEVTIPSIIDEKIVTGIGMQAFSRCSSLTSIEIPQGVTSIEMYAFFECSSLTSIEIPEGVTSIKAQAFSGCSSLTSIEIPSSVTNIGDIVFADCSSLTAIEVTSDNKNYASVEGVLFNKDKTILIRYPESKVNTEYSIPSSVTSIDKSAFYECSSLTSIEIPNNVKKIRASAFSGCSSLRNIEIPNSVTSIENNAFRSCSSLTSIKIPEGVKSIEDFTFFECSSLTSIEIPNSVKIIEDEAFRRCSSLTSINIPSSMTGIENNAFEECSALTRIEIPSSTSKIGKCVFNHCTSLENIEVSEENINYSSENGILFNKEKTKLIVYPANKQGESYIISSNVEEIEKNAFSYCRNIQKIVIPDSVISIGENAFCEWNRESIIYTNSESVSEYAELNSVNYVFDNVAPTIESVIGSPTIWTKEDVTLTINGAVDEGVGLADKLYSFDGGTTWQAENTKTYTENKEGIVIKVKDLLGNVYTHEVVNITNIDRIAPEIYIEYNKTELTNENVVATITSNEEMQELEGWTLSQDELTLTKIYEANANESVTIKDLAGNETVVEVNIQNIDKTAPEAKITYSITELTNQNVIVTINSNEKLQQLNSWTLSEDKLTLTKEYTANTTENVIIKDLVGNQTVVNVSIQNIDKTPEKVDIIVKEENTYIKKEENGSNYIENIDVNLSIQEFLSNVESKGEIKIYKGNQIQTDKTKKLATGMNVVVEKDGQEVIRYEVVVKGDLDGDGQMTQIDLLKLARYKVGLDKTLKGSYLKASDTNRDSKYAQDVDLLKIARNLVGLK